MKFFTLKSALVFLLAGILTQNNFAQNYQEVIGAPFENLYDGSIAFSDIDNDGDQDVLITGRDATTFLPVASLYKNDGVGNYTIVAGTTLPPVYESAIAFGDVDGDGDEDVMVSGRNTANTRIAEMYINDGAGNFTRNFAHTLVGVKASSAVFADVNGDTELDLVIAGMEGNNDYVTRVYINQGGVNHVVAYDVGWSVGLQGVAYGSIDLADIDGDSDLDLLITGQNTSLGRTTNLYTNNGSGFTEISHPFEVIFSSSIGFQDLDNDNYPELVLTGQNTTGNIGRLYKNNAGTFTQTQTLSDVAFGSIAFADVNNDGFSDLLVSGGKSNGQRVSDIYTSNGAGGLSLFSSAGITGVYLSSVALADIDGNGTIDALTIGQDGANVRATRLYKNISCFDALSDTSITACGSYTVPSGATTYTTFGNYTVTDTKVGVTYCGKDSVLKIDLTLYENPDYNVTQTGSNPICLGSTTIELSGSEIGVNYYLREGTTVVDGPIVGDGNALSFTTPSISASTTYNVFADAVACTRQMSQTVTVDVDPIPEVALSETSSQIICSGSATIEASSSELGVDYFLRDTNNIIVNGPIAGTGSAISFSTNEIYEATTYNVVAKKKGYALDFDGVDDYAGIALANGLPTGGVITIEAWVKRREEKYMGIVFYGSQTCQSAANLLFTEKGRSSWSNWCNGISDASGPTVKLDKWSHVAVVMNGTEIRMYMDGQEFVGALPLSPSLVNGVLELGRVGIFNQYFKGEMDEVRVWNTARTKQEIRDNAFTELAGNEAGLVAYFNMEAGVGGNTVFDLTGNGNNLTMYNMDPVTDWVTGLGTCEKVFTQTVSVDVDPIPEVTITETSNPIICSGMATIETSSSEVGVDYYLSEGANIVDGPIIGNGSTLSFTTPEIDSESTFIVTANQSNTAIYFDGIGDGMDVNAEKLYLHGAGPVELTISFWVNPSLTQNDDCSLIQTSLGETRGFKIVQNGNNVNQYYFAYSNSIDFFGDQILSQLAGNQWQQFTIVKNGTTITHYVNGIETATGITASSGAISSPSHDYLRFGIGDGPLGFKGGIDETSIWRTALSPTQVADLYSLGIEEHKDLAVTYWSMNEGVGNAVIQNEFSQNYSITMIGDMDPNTSWGNGPILPSLCSYQMAQTVTVGIDPLPAITISETSDPIICSGSATIEAPSSESNVAYFLRNDIDNSVVDGPVFGNDGAINLTTRVIENTTDYKVTGASLQGALEFDGVDDYIQIDHQVVPTSGDFTVSVWAKHGSNEAVYQEIVSQGNLGDAFYIGKADNGIIRLGDTWTIPSFTFPTDNEWHHYTVVKTSSDAHFYFDGILTASKGSTIPNPQGKVFRIGEQYTAAGGEQFEGGIDEIKVWSAALNPVEILSEMSNCEEPLETNLVAYYAFEEAGGSIVYDASQNEFHGTLLNMNPATDWITNTGLSCGQCSEEALITINVSSITPQAVTIDQSNLCAAPGSTDIRVPTTENDISYYLKVQGNSSIINTPVKGNGSEVIINTGSVAADETFEVYGAKHTEKYGVEFDGIDDKLIPNSRMYFTNNFTYEFWAAPTTTHDIDPEENSGVQGAIGQGRYLVWPDYSNITGAGLGISVGTNGVSVYEHKSNHLPAVLVYATTITGWTHIAVSCENGLTRLYLNGSLVKTGLPSVEPLVYPSVGLGGDVYGHYEGGLAEFKLWNYTRSQVNIQASMDDHCLNGTENGLAVYYPFTEGAGSTVEDYSFNRKDAAFSGTAGLWVDTDLQFDCLDCEVEMANKVSVTFGDTEAPVPDSTSLPDLTDPCSVAISVYPTATDNCGGTIVATTGEPLAYGDQGNFTITWSFIDGNSNVSTQTQNVVIDDQSAPLPNVSSLDTIKGECSATVSVTPTASDNCGGTIIGTTSDPLTYTVQGTFAITWTYNDGNGNISNQVQIVVVTDQTAPEPDVVSLSEISGECSATVSVTPTATDLCEGSIIGTTSDPLTYTSLGVHTITWSFDDGNGNSSTQDQTVKVEDTFAPVPDVVSLPLVSGECSVTLTAPTAIDACEGIIIATTTDPTSYTEVGNYSVIWTYTDSEGNFDTQAQNVEVIDTQAPVPDAVNLLAATGNCSVTVSAVPTATDACDGVITGTTTDPLTYTTVGNDTITWVFTDSEGNFITQKQPIEVFVDAAPIPDLASLPIISDGCTGSVTVTTTPTATDECDGVITGTTTDPLTYTSEGNYTITWSYTDSKNNTSIQTQAVDVIIDLAPVPDIENLPTITEECSASITVTPTATDDCDGVITATTADPLFYTAEGNYIITWSFTDSKGNVSTQTQTVIIDDQTDPVPNLTSLPDVTGVCSATATPPTSTDNCLGTITGETTDPITYTTTGTHQITWVFNDASNNSSTQTQNVIISGVDTTVSVIGGTTLVAEAIGPTFQWLDCDDSYNPIIGESSALFQPLINGSYAVQVTDVGCVDTSQCFTIIITSIEDELESKLNVYPVPSNSYIYVEHDSEISYIKVLDIHSKEMNIETTSTSDGYTLDVQGLAKGIYVLFIEVDGIVITRKIIIE